MAMFGGTSTCFTILWTPNFPLHVQDPAVRGPARIADGKLALGYSVIPNDPGCEGTGTYAISSDGWTLTGLQVPPCAGYLAFTRH